MSEDTQNLLALIQELQTQVKQLQGRLSKIDNPFKPVFIARQGNTESQWQEQVPVNGAIIDMSGGRKCEDDSSNAALLDLADDQFAMVQVRDGDKYRYVRLPVGGGGSDFKIEYGVSRDAETGDKGNVWNKTTNEVYLTPCVDFSDPTPTGDPALPCDIYTPNNIDIRNAVIEPSKIYAYVRIYHTVAGVTSFRGLILPTEHGVKVMSQSVSGTTSTTLASYYGVKEIAFNSSNIAVDKIDDRSVRVTVNDPVGEEVTVVTAVQVNTTTLTLEVKTRTITVLSAGAESDWTTVIEGTDCNSSSSSSSSSSSETNLCVTGESLSPDVTGTYIPSEPLGGDDIWTRSTPNADYYIDRDPVSGDAWIRSSSNGDYLFEATALLGTYTPIDPSTGSPTVAECGGA